VGAGRTRAYRRHQFERVKRRMRAYYGGVHRGDPRRLGGLAQMRTPRSCWMCGNPQSGIGGQ
jgi:hypothetical protein